MSKVSFNNAQSPFYTTLKGKVNHYFSENNLHTSGNKKLYIKSAIQIGSVAALYIVLVFFTPSPWIAIPCCALFGIGLAAIGFNIMHEGGHQSFSRHSWLNRLGAYFLNALGGNTFYWTIKHNINHHTYTNIEGMDSDINVKPFMRLHENQNQLWIHKFQHLYCFLLYGLSYFVWIFWDDFEKYFTGKIAAGCKRRMDAKEHIIFWITKSVYVLVYIVIPVLMTGIVKAAIGFAVVAFVCGLTLAIVFQLAHVVEGTAFPEPDQATNKIEKEWAIHQVVTTANFSTRSSLVSWLLGGLNFQVEHHLFPRISHIHYPKINQFVIETCRQYNVGYLEYPSMFKAIQAHVSHIRKMGNE